MQYKCENIFCLIITKNQYILYHKYWNKIMKKKEIKQSWSINYDIINKHKPY